MCLEKAQIQIISDESLFPTLQSFRMVIRNCMIWNFCGIVNIWSSKTICEYFASIAIYSTTPRQMNTADIQILPACRYFRYIQVDWEGLIVTTNMDDVITLPSRRKVLVQMNYDLKQIGPREPCHEWISSRVPDNVIDQNKSTEETTALALMTAHTVQSICVKISWVWKHQII